MTEEVIKHKKSRKLMGLFLTVPISLLCYLFITMILVEIEGFIFFKLFVFMFVASLFIWVDILFLKVLLSKKQALIINKEGIVDSSSPTGVGFIPWSDIEGWEEATGSLNTKLILIKLKNPSDYIKKNGLKMSFIRKSYMQQFNTPVVIIVKNLNVKIDKLIGFLKVYQ